MLNKMCLRVFILHYFHGPYSLDMVDKAGVGGKNELVRNDLVMKQTN